MITKLKPEQEARFQEFVDKWIKIGLSTERADRPRAERAIKNMYKMANLSEPKIIWCPCPISASLSALIIGSMGLRPNMKKSPAVGSAVRSAVGSAVNSAVNSAVYSAVYSAVNSAVGSAVRSAVGSAVYSAVGSAVDSAVDSAVGSAVRSAVGSAVRSAVVSAVNSAVDSAVGSAVRSAVGSAVRSAVVSAVNSAVDSAVGSAVGNKIKLNSENGISYLGGQFWSGYPAWADFFNTVCEISIDRNYLDAAESLGYYFCLDGFCITSERPVEINRNSQSQLHADGKMAISYESGWGIYSLNGTTVPQYLAMTPEGKLDIEFFKKEQNADVKAEFIRKYGIERMKHLGKTVDSWKKYDNEWFEKSEYELIDMASIFTSHRYAPFLAMKNQTTGTYHIEGVDPNCKTIEDALKFRFNNRRATIVNIK